MMKTTTFLLLLLIPLTATYSQLDITANPIGIVTDGEAKVALEFGINNRIGLEPSVGFNVSDESSLHELSQINTSILMKIYFKDNGVRKGFFGGPLLQLNKQDDADGSVLGSFLKTRQIGIGAAIGYKLIAIKRLVLDVQFGSTKQLDGFSLASINPFKNGSRNSYLRFGAGFRF